MADTARRIFCSTCGKEINIHYANSYWTGRSTIYECQECYEKGQNYAKGHMAKIGARYRKEKNL